MVPMTDRQVANDARLLVPSHQCLEIWILLNTITKSAKLNIYLREVVILGKSPGRDIEEAKGNSNSCYPGLYPG